MNYLVRYFRSPEFILAAANFALMLALWQFRWIGEIGPYIRPIETALPFSASTNHLVAESFVVCLLAIFMLPITWFLLLAAILKLIVFSRLELWASIGWLSLPNAVLWGFLVAFLFRLIRTGSIATARAATLRWKTGREGLVVGVASNE